ncbi:hypothetical protein ACOMHN_060853 [Nucella lapillus]
MLDHGGRGGGTDRGVCVLCERDRLGEDCQREQGRDITVGGDGGRLLTQGSPQGSDDLPATIAVCVG